MGAPTRATRVRPGDLLVLYGRAASVQELDERRSGLSGDREHREAVAEQDDVVRNQERQEREAGGAST